MYTEKFPLVLFGGWAEGQACADPGARTPIGTSGNYLNIYTGTTLAGPHQKWLFWDILTLTYRSNLKICFRRVWKVWDSNSWFYKLHTSLGVLLTMFTHFFQMANIAKISRSTLCTTVTTMLFVSFWNFPNIKKYWTNCIEINTIK